MPTPKYFNYSFRTFILKTPNFLPTRTRAHARTHSLLLNMAITISTLIKNFCLKKIIFHFLFRFISISLSIFPLYYSLCFSCIVTRLDYRQFNIDHFFLPLSLPFLLPIFHFLSLSHCLSLSLLIFRRLKKGVNNYNSLLSVIIK